MLTPGHSSLGFSRESPAGRYGELISLIGNQRVGIFPPKSENSLRPIPSFDMMSKFPGSDHSCRRRYVHKLLAERKKNNNNNNNNKNKIKKYRVQGSRF